MYRQKVIWNLVLLLKIITHFCVFMFYRTGVEYNLQLKNMVIFQI